METTTQAFSNVTDAANFDVPTIPEWTKYMWLALFWVITITGTIGNSVVIWIVLAHKNMRTVTNIFLVNLAIADLLLCSLNVPFVSFQLLFEYWPFGPYVCKLNEFIAATSICITVFTLSMIAIDRYMAIMYPFKLRLGVSQNIVILIIICVISIVVSSPNWILVQLARYGENTIVCAQIWPKNLLKTTYRVLFMIITYFLPLTCMTFSYGRMGFVLWKMKSIGEKSESQLKKDLAKRKIVKMMIIVVIVFTICWLPFHLMFILGAAGLLKRSILVVQIFNGTFWFAMSNSMYNPIVYCWMNARFRAGFKKAFRWCPCITYDAALDKIHFPKTIGDKSIVTEAV